MESRFVTKRKITYLGEEIFTSFRTVQSNVSNLSLNKKMAFNTKR